MAIIELCEDDGPIYDQQKPKNLDSASPITQEAASLRTDSSLAEGKDPGVQPSSTGLQPQTPAQGAEPTPQPDETPTRTRTGMCFP